MPTTTSDSPTTAESSPPAQEALDRWGYGLASVRFICGTQQLHRQLEVRLSQFLGTEDTILYTSCFDANGGLFETLLGPDDAVISDELNHASIIDGIRPLEGSPLPLQKQRHGRPGVETPRGSRRPLPPRGHRRRVFDGRNHRQPARHLRSGRQVRRAGHWSTTRTPSASWVRADAARRNTTAWTDRVDIVTGTLGKALGGASGGYTSGRREIVELLRQRSRPYLFSNTLAPPIVGASLATIDLLAESNELRRRLMGNTRTFRQGMFERGFQIVPGQHPIVPIMLGDAALASKMADLLLERGIYVIAFSYPVVPQRKARIRVQVSAVHTPDDIAFAMEAFSAVKEELEL